GLALFALLLSAAAPQPAVARTGATQTAVAPLVAAQDAADDRSEARRASEAQESSEGAAGSQENDRPQTTAAEAPIDFRFVHLTDTHLGSSAGNRALERLINDIKALSPAPAFIVNGGDLTEFGSEEQYAFYEQR